MSFSETQDMTVRSPSKWRSAWEFYVNRYNKRSVNLDHAFSVLNSAKYIVARFRFINAGEQSVNVVEDRTYVACGRTINRLCNHPLFSHPSWHKAALQVTNPKF